MTDEASEARRVLSVLRERPHSIDPARTEARRARSVPLLERQVEQLAVKRRIRRERRIAVGAAVAAAAVAAAIALVTGFRARGAAPAAPSTAIRAVDGHLRHRASGAWQTVSAGDELALPVSGELETDPGSRATLSTAEGLMIGVEGGSRLTLAGMYPTLPDRSVELQEGQIQCAVPRLPQGHHFSVITPNARVIVHGTRFSVRVDSPATGLTRTCVRVTEGVVSVHRGSDAATLRAGDAWGCDGNEPRAVVAAPERRVAAAPSRDVPRNAAPSRVLRTGTLAEETALLQTALAAERRGQRAAALSAVTTLLARFPDSQLAVDARGVLGRLSRPAAPTASPAAP